LLVVEETLDIRPEGKSDGVLGLLDPVDAVGVNNDAVIEIGAGGHRSPFVTSETDREQAALSRLAEGSDDIVGVAARRETHCHVTLPTVGDQLPGEHELEADVVAERRQRRLVGHEGTSSQCSTRRRSREECRQRGRIGGAPTVAEAEHPCAGEKALSHFGRELGEGGGVLVEGGVPEPEALGGLAFGGAGEVSEQANGVVLVGFDERV
jgi:hypothetical protein